MKISVQDNGLKVSPKIHLLRPNSQGDGIRSWGNREGDEVMRANSQEWDYALIKEILESFPLPCEDTRSQHL